MRDLLGKRMSVAGGGVKLLARALVILRPAGFAGRRICALRGELQRSFGANCARHDRADACTDLRDDIRDIVSANAIRFGRTMIVPENLSS
jgi:hypothetical protein